MSIFIKLKSPNFERLRNSKRKGKLLNMIIDFENIDILKERDGDNLGFHNFRILDFEIIIILKEGKVLI